MFASSYRNYTLPLNVWNVYILPVMKPKGMQSLLNYDYINKWSCSHSSRRMATVWYNGITWLLPIRSPRKGQAFPLACYSLTDCSPGLHTTEWSRFEHSGKTLTWNPTCCASSVGSTLAMKADGLDGGCGFLHGTTLSPPWYACVAWQ